MMKRILLFALPLAGLIACNNQGPDKDASIVPEKTTVATTPDTATNTALPANAASLTPAASQQQPQVVSTSQPVAVPTAATGGAGLNPAHGQPGHRCDIAVGAPLNSPATQPTQSPAIQTNQPAVNVPITAPSKGPSSGTAKLNPPHGQPGHDCAVPVGQPLN